MGASEKLFDRVRDRLPGKQSAYERTWLKLLSNVPPHSGYPNSAAFLVTLWPHRYSLLLCEKDPSTVRDLNLWKAETRQNRTGIDTHDGDWRDRFRREIVPHGDLVFFSFDPNMFDRSPHIKHTKAENMYPGDLRLLASIIRGISQGIIVQLSTYSANNDNSQVTVVECVTSLLKSSGMRLAAKVVADGNMMSLVLTRGIDWDDLFCLLPNRFRSWLRDP